VVDFVPDEEADPRRSTEIDLETVVAMYQNNRAAESLAAGELDAAYAWARAALLRAPSYASALNTLAVVYERRGLPDAAERALLAALAQAALGETAASRDELAAAMRASTTLREREIYAAKLDRLNALR
jgi:tetratricopeptide (TPR) repeat protein